MSAYAAPIEVIKAALHRVGEEAIDSLTDDIPAAVIAASNYEPIVRGFFARHAWTFAKRTLDLTFQQDVTLGRWTSAYAIPVIVTNVREVLASGRPLGAEQYAIEGRQVLSLGGSPTPTALQVVATIRAHESDWADDFAEAVTTRLVGLFQESLLDKPQDARMSKRDAEELIRNAIVRDKRQEPGVSRARFTPLVDTWRGGRVRGVG